MCALGVVVGVFVGAFAVCWHGCVVGVLVGWCCRGCWFVCRGHSHITNPTPRPDEARHNGALDGGRAPALSGRHENPWSVLGARCWRALCGCWAVVFCALLRLLALRPAVEVACLFPLSFVVPPHTFLQAGPGPGSPTWFKHARLSRYLLAGSPKQPAPHARTLEPSRPRRAPPAPVTALPPPRPGPLARPEVRPGVGLAGRPPKPCRFCRSHLDDDDSHRPVNFHLLLHLHLLLILVFPF